MVREGEVGGRGVAERYCQRNRQRRRDSVECAGAGCLQSTSATASAPPPCLTLLLAAELVGMSDSNRGGRRADTEREALLRHDGVV